MCLKICNNIIKSVYMAFCQFFLMYYVSRCSGAAKSNLFKVECTQITILKRLKVDWKLHFLYPTAKLHKYCEVLTFRQLFILYTVLKAHAEVFFLIQFL